MGCRTATLVARRTRNVCIPMPNLTYEREQTVFLNFVAVADLGC
jgi:hypothetical protein